MRMIQREPVDWRQIVAFLDQQEPGFGDRIRGASADEIAALQQRSGAPLPENFVGFLRHMGAAHGGFPVHPEHGYLIQDLLGFPADEVGWDRRRHLLIGFMLYPVREDPHDLFFDLLRGDPIDAPIVGFQRVPDATVMNLEQGLADLVIFRAAWRYRISGSDVRVRLISWCRGGADGELILRRQRELVGLLGRIGFEPCVPATPHTWFGRREADTFALAQIEPDDRLISVELSGADPRSVMQAREVLQDQGPMERDRIVVDGPP